MSQAAFVKEELQNLFCSEKKETRLLELLRQMQPYDLAEIFRDLDVDLQRELITHLSLAHAAEVLEYLEPERTYELLSRMDETVTSLLIKQMSSDMVVDLLLAIHPLQAEKLQRLLPADYRKKIKQLMTYPEDTAGGLMTVDYVSARAYWTGEQTIRHIRKVGYEAEIVSYIYVTDQRGKLFGVASLKEIILADPKTPLSDIAKTDIISVPAETGQEEVASGFVPLRFLCRTRRGPATPVDRNRHLR
jgi:magnesium transporter